MMHNSARSSLLLVRIGFVLLVVAGIAGFLYTSHLTRLLGSSRSITILAWPQEIDAAEFVAFEQKTGIKVNVRYFENNEELAVKLATEGHGIDVVMPTDYAAEVFIKQGFLKKLDKSKLDFLSTLNPQLTGHYFDPENQYTIPYYWGVYGIGFDKDYCAQKPSIAFGAQAPSWGILFDKKYKDAHIAMPDNARYLTLIAAQYLFGSIDNIQVHQLEQIKRFLITQKPLVELYTESRGEYLLASKASALVVLLSADVAKAMRYFEHVDFMIPKEGTFLLIDSFALSAQTHKDELIYQFLNYLYKPEVLQEYVDKFTFFPATTNVTPAFQPEQLQIPTDAQVNKLDSFRNVVPKGVLSAIWIALKS